MFYVLSCHLKVKLKYQIFLTVKNFTITNINDIAEEFDYHFSTLSKSLASSNTNKEKSATSYFKNRCTNLICLQPTATYEIMTLFAGNSTVMFVLSVQKNLLPCTLLFCQKPTIKKSKR